MMSKCRHPRYVVSAAVATSSLLLLAATAQGSAGLRISAGNPTIVTVTAGKPTEYQFKLSPISVKHGTVVFKFTNAGKAPHGFTINGKATKVIRPHRSAVLTVFFKKAGRYLYQCAEAHVDPNQENLVQVGSAGACGGGILKVT
jgi:plastocyanin